jgi:hypothetical protein
MGKYGQFYGQLSNRIASNTEAKGLVFQVDARFNRSHFAECGLSPEPQNIEVKSTER